MSTVLIIEDNDKNMKLARDVLQNKGYKTLEAVTGEEGVKLAKDNVPDLVLMDIQLPGINGIEAFKQLRADPKTARIPVVALTASVTPTCISPGTTSLVRLPAVRPSTIRSCATTARPARTWST